MCFSAMIFDVQVSRSAFSIQSSPTPYGPPLLRIPLHTCRHLTTPTVSNQLHSSVRPQRQSHLASATGWTQITLKLLICFPLLAALSRPSEVLSQESHVAPPTRADPSWPSNDFLCTANGGKITSGCACCRFRRQLQPSCPWNRKVHG